MGAPSETVVVPTELHTKATSELEKEVAKELEKEEDTEKAKASFREALDSKDEDKE